MNCPDLFNALPPSPSARCTTACCSRRCASSSSARRSTRSRRRRSSSDGRLAIEPSANPSALIIRWFGTRYTLRVPGRWPFTAHEVRLAQAIGAVLAARYRAILNPRIIAERGDLFRGAIEDRYVGAFLDHRPYAIEAREARADRIASVIELLRVAALSSYENRPISTGVLLLGTSDDPVPPGSAADVGRPGVHRVADGDQELLPSGRRRAHGVSGQRRGPAARHHRRRALGRAGLRASDSSQVAVRAAPTSRTRARRCSTGTCARCSARRARSRSSRKGRRCSRSAAPPGTCSTCRRSIACGRRRSATTRWRCGSSRPRSTWPTRAKARCSSSSRDPRRRGHAAGGPRRSPRHADAARRADAGRRAVAPGSASPARRALGHGSRSERACGAGVARRRDGGGPDGPAAGRRRDPAPSAVGRRRARRRRSKAHGRPRRWRPAGSVRC